MANEPTLGRGYENPSEWVIQLQKMLNAVRPGMMLGQLYESGIYDDETFSAVEDFQTRAQIHLDGIAGPDTWTALWQWFEASRSQQVPEPDTTPGLAPPAVDTDEKPPTVQDFERGADVMHALAGKAIEAAHAYAEKLSGIKPESVTKDVLEDAAEAALLALEIFTEVVPPISAVLGPFLIWYKSLVGDDAIELYKLRWQVLAPFRDGCLAGIYMHGTQNVDPEALQPVLDKAFTDANGLSEPDKKAVLTYLLEVSVAGGGRTLMADHPTMDAARWGLRHYQNGYTYDGIQTMLSAQDR